MNQITTDIGELCHRYATTGYAILRTAIDSEAIAAARREADRLCTLTYSMPEADRTNDVVLLRHLSEAQREGITVTGDTPFIIGNIPAYSIFLTHLLITPAIMQVTQALLNCADPEYHFSNLTMKAAGIGPHIRAHRDYPNKYHCPAAPVFLRVLLCLDAMDAANGATTVAVGSHLHEGTADSMDDYNVETAVCNAGDALFIHPCALHGGGGNRSPRQRRVMVAQW
ncbi:MAG: phytanoyl-CoA dioxygenase family protein, partial [Candidatus Kapabacteria bacterium]|nr:phytanoyl-CoA dioxygenase family protein [Candidatus Kapabacteria bacterium]